MRSSKSAIRPKPLIVSAAVSLLVLAAGAYWIDGLTARRLYAGLLWPLLRLMALIGVGLVVGQLVEATGWTRYLAVLAGPLFRFGNLGPQCSAAFTTAFFSGVAANAMLLDFYKEGTITRRQLFLTNFINQLPAYFLHLPTTFFMVIPLTGLAGVLYFLITFVAALARTLLFFLYGRLHPPGGAEGSDPAAMAAKPVKERPKTRNLWQAIGRKLPGRLMGIAVFVVPIYIIVFTASAMGLFEALRQWTTRFVSTTFIPVESLSVVVLSFAAEFTSGFAAAGALMDAGVLTVKQTVTALLIGNVVAFPIRALRHQLPRYMGIFAPKMGTQLLLLGQAFRVSSIVAVGAAYYLLF
jgi:hypothetical protein